MFDETPGSRMPSQRGYDRRPVTIMLALIAAALLAVAILAYVTRS